jgi:hypothetical protein
MIGNVELNEGDLGELMLKCAIDYVYDRNTSKLWNQMSLITR